MNELIKIKVIVERVANVGSISTKSKEHHLADARRIYCYLARKLTTYSYREIGEVINRDYSTVIYLINKTEELIEFDKDFEQLFNRCLLNTTELQEENSIQFKYNYHLNQARIYRRWLNELNDRNNNKFNK